MFLRIAFVWALAVTGSSWQSSTTTGSISGTVQEKAHSGKPIAGAGVHVSPGGKSAETNANGHYQIKDLAAGTYSVKVHLHGVGGPQGAKVVQISSGQDLAVDFQLLPMGRISGRVVDETGEPAPGVGVFLIAREYRLGSLRYVYARFAQTDDRGQYELTNIESGRAYLIEATKRIQKLNSNSDLPADFRLRRNTAIPTWYPDSDSPEGAQALALQPGEHREGMEIRMRRSVSYCMDGVLSSDTGPDALEFWLEESEPTSGESGEGNGVFLSLPSGKAGPDGKIRVCDLHPGTYRLLAMDSDWDSKGAPMFFGEMQFSIRDKDLHDVRVVGHGRIAVAGEIVWDAKPPEQLVSGKLSVSLRPMTRAPFMQEIGAGEVESSVPGQFTFLLLLTDDYVVKLMHVPPGAYVKDVVYGGLSALHASMRVGKTMGSDLRVVLAHDGGTLNVKVADKDGNPIPDCQVVLLPAEASTEVMAADTMIKGQTDQYGTYSSGSIAPGKYFVLATNSSVDRTPESLEKLLLSRTHAREAELPPNGSVQIVLSPIELE
ncbi:MAG: carboxypeptidase regulatory-like domain-containing protein [Acidobacteriota bacterium]|nr:carboxypeptidase regulatory-like domain-containing protein [Acidobacteriota bacterium]